MALWEHFFAVFLKPENLPLINEQPFLKCFHAFAGISAYHKGSVGRTERSRQEQ